MRQYGSTSISICHDWHRHEEWLTFLRLIDRKRPKHLQVHPVVNNRATRKHRAVQQWLLAHPRLVMHLTPTSAS
jgi:hypothetical protein